MVTYQRWSPPPAKELPLPLLASTTCHELKVAELQYCHAGCLNLAQVCNKKSQVLWVTWYNGTVTSRRQFFLCLHQPLALTLFLQCYLSLGGGVCYRCPIYRRADRSTFNIETAMTPNLWNCSSLDLTPSSWMWRLLYDIRSGGKEVGMCILTGRDVWGPGRKAKLTAWVLECMRWVWWEDHLPCFLNTTWWPFFFLSFQSFRERKDAFWLSRKGR